MRPLAKPLTAAELIELEEDEDLRRRLQDVARLEYETIAERYGTEGVHALYAALQTAQADYAVARKARDLPLAAKFLALVVNCADKLASRMENLEVRRDRKAAVGELSQHAQPIIQLMPVAANGD